MGRAKQSAHCAGAGEDAGFWYLRPFYTFEAGHKLRITLATEDLPYLRPTTNPFIVTVHPGSKVTFRTGSWLSAPDQVSPTPEEVEEVPPTIFDGLTSLQELIFDFLGVEL
ncbi:MAG: hypothetical protein SGI88_10050 [Candidatus Hydrogenedentes bacterium]|nr:hypothetical protein [Candidatus Hydrogenedentota bacterium]